MTTAPSGSARRRWTRFALRAVVIVCVAGALTGVWAVFVEPRRLVVRDVALPLPAFRDAPLTVVLLADLHVGAPGVPLAKLDRIVDEVNALEADAVLLLGDYVISGIVGGTRIPPRDLTPALARLRSRFGTFAVLGNHDWWEGGPDARAALQAAGVTVLEDAAVPVGSGPARVWLAGLKDEITQRPDVARTLSDIPITDPVILLTHSPDVFPDVPARVALTVAGHTHGGQMRFPFLGAPVVPSRYGQRYAAGLVVEEGRSIFVTTGIGTSILPVRLGVPPEIVRLRLGR